MQFQFELFHQVKILRLVWHIHIKSHRELFLHNLEA